MARGKNNGYKRGAKSKSREEIKCSDESDEDYNIDEEEEFNESGDDCSFADEQSEDSFSLAMEEEDEEEWIEKKVKKMGKPRARKCSQSRKKNGAVVPRRKMVVYSDGDDVDEDGCSYGDSSGTKQRKRAKVSYKEEDDDETEVLYREEENEFIDEIPRKECRPPGHELTGDSHNGNLKKKYKVSHDDDDYEYEYSCNEEDEEFTPVDVLKKSRKSPVKNQTRRRNSRSNGSREFRGEKAAPCKRKTVEGWSWGRRRNVTVKSDSDFVSSGTSDYEYTVSEEEREQIKETTKFCGRMSTSLRSSRSSKMIKEEKISPSKGRRLARKGKQEVVELVEVGGKRVCGVCLSEEGKRTVRGILNCCSHYFCFACIMAWSKVESRCPLCKQRFATISKTTRAESGHDLTGAVFPVPECDQVYQPSEEELRGYLDPYENVLCTECMQGGDDALMLLCDLCDSPAHSYCVGLGHEVPEGNWYCDGCRPTVLASSNFLATNPVPDHGANNNMPLSSPPVTSVRETFDLNEVYVPDTPLSQGTGHSQPPFVGHFQVNSPVSGTGAFTLFERRRIQRQIHQLLNNRIRQPVHSDVVTPESTINLFGSPITPDWVMAAAQNTAIPSRAVPRSIHPLSRQPDLYLGSRASSSTSRTSDGLFHGFSATNSRIGNGLGHPQPHPCSGTSNSGADVNSSLYQYREATVATRTLELYPYQQI